MLFCSTGDIRIDSSETQTRAKYVRTLPVALQFRRTKVILHFLEFSKKIGGRFSFHEFSFRVEVGGRRRESWKGDQSRPLERRPDDSSSVLMLGM
jgi:hypothetical protein